MTYSDCKVDSSTPHHGRETTHAFVGIRYWFIFTSRCESYFHTIAAISPCTSEKLAEPALGCAGSDSDLCKTCSVLLCVLVQPKVDKSSAGLLSAGPIGRNWSN
jgi:hypothetical protein